MRAAGVATLVALACAHAEEAPDVAAVSLVRILARDLEALRAEVKDLRAIISHVVEKKGVEVLPAGTHRALSESVAVPAMASSHSPTVNLNEGGTLTINSGGSLALSTQARSGVESAIQVGSDGKLRFSTGNGTDEIERMRLTADGKLGIGTIAPSTTLEVVGGAKLSGTLEAASATLTSAAIDVLTVPRIHMSKFELYSAAPYFPTKETCKANSPCSDGSTSGYKYWGAGYSKLDIKLGKLCGYMKVSVSSGWNFRHSTGLVEKEFGGCFLYRGNDNADDYGGTGRYTKAFHNTKGQFSISNPWYDVGEHTFKITIIDIANKPNSAFTKVEMLGDHTPPEFGEVYQRAPSHYSPSYGWAGDKGMGNQAWWNEAHAEPVEGKSVGWSWGNVKG